MSSVVRVVKTDLNGDKRRFTCATDSFAGLVRQISGTYTIPPQELAISYVDDEGDTITVANDADLAMAWELLGGKPLLKLSVQRCAAASQPEPSAVPEPAAAQGTSSNPSPEPAQPAGFADVAQGVPCEVLQMMRSLAPLLRSEMEKLPTKLEQMGKVINAMAERAEAESRPHVCRARNTAAAAATAAATSAADTAHQASEHAQAAAKQALEVAEARLEQATAMATAAADFLPPAYREAVNRGLEAATADANAVARDFLPPAYRAAVDAAAGRAPADTSRNCAAPKAERSGTTEEQQCKQKLAAKFGVEVATIALPSLTLPELQIVANNAESLPQLQVIEAAMKARCHLGIWCDSTGAKPIRGTRYTKPGAAGDTYDLCEAAWKALSPSEQKDFTVVERPDVYVLLRTSRSVIEPVADPAEPSTVDVDETPSQADLDAAWAAKARALRAQGIDASPPQPPVPAPETTVSAEQQTELLVSVDSIDSPQDPRVANEQEAEVPEQVVMASPLPASVAVENFDQFPADDACANEADESAEIDPLIHVPEIYRSQVGRLIEMGYSQSVAQLTELVAANDGDLHATVVAMLGQ